MKTLVLSAAELSELSQFAHVNFRGPEYDMLMRWLNAKLSDRANPESEEKPPALFQSKAA